MAHPYTKFENTRTWKVISDALSELEENQDFILQTKKEYVIGFLTSRIESDGALPPSDK